MFVFAEQRTNERREGKEKPAPARREDGYYLLLIQNFQLGGGAWFGCLWVRIRKRKKRKIKIKGVGAGRRLQQKRLREKKLKPKPPGKGAAVKGLRRREKISLMGGGGWFFVKEKKNVRVSFLCFWFPLP